jgi:hypothetical protein
MYLNFDRESAFPNLKRKEYHVTSNETTDYNCIAHAAGVDNKWWWPVKEDIEGVHWPAEVPREETIECFVLAFELQGYKLCDNAELEPSFEKVILYIDCDGLPTHAARQLPSGAWTSKLGGWEDIEHATPEALGHDLDGIAYGKPAKILKRHRT